MAELKYTPVPHDHKAFLAKARTRKGFTEAFDALALEYQVAWAARGGTAARGQVLPFASIARPVIFRTKAEMPDPHLSQTARLNLRLASRG